MTGKEEFQKWAQASAVLQHDKDADWFAEQYKKEADCYSSPFLYGRKQFCAFFEQEISGLPKGARILDIGCGTGTQVAQLRGRGFEACGIEPSEKMRSHAESILPAGAVIDGSVIELPYEDNSFDFVYSIEVFRYLSETDNVGGLREIRRVLRPGGVFFGTFVNRYALDGFYLLVLLRRLRCKVLGGTIGCHTEFETPGELERRMAAVGFSSVRTHGAMLAPLRLAYKAATPLGAVCARLLEPIDPYLSDRRLARAFSGHLIGVARK